MIATKRANVGSSCYGRQLIFKRPWVRIQVLCNGWIWYLFTLICCKNCIVCLKRPKISKKRPGFAYLHYCSFTSFTYLPTFLFAQMFSAVVMLWILFCQMLFPIENILSWKKYCSLLLKYIQSCYVIQCEYNIERITKLASGWERVVASDTRGNSSNPVICHFLLYRTYENKKKNVKICQISDRIDNVNSNFRLGRELCPSGKRWEKTHVQKVVGLNPGTGYWIVIFHILW